MSVRALITEFDLGTGWQTLQQQRRLRGRSPRDQIKAWLRYAAAQAQDGVDVELSQERLEALLGEDSLAVA